MVLLLHPYHSSSSASQIQTHNLDPLISVYEGYPVRKICEFVSLAGEGNVMVCVPRRGGLQCMSLLSHRVRML